jgi:hypothetical protein
VVVSFTIGSDGRVWRAEEELATFPDRDARRCLLQRFFELRFPEPPEQRLTIRYPLLITSGGSRPPEPLRDARRAAAPPPPGFAEAMRSGRRVSEATEAPAREAPAREAPAPQTAPAKPCRDDDPMCPAL